MKLTSRDRTQLRAALKEDIGKGDVTSSLLILSSARGKAAVIARESGVFCGRDIARELFKITDPKLSVKFLISDGKSFKKGKTLFKITGRVQSILKAERTVLNLLGHLCGIASRTREFVKNAKGVDILDTRKTTPLWRSFEKYAVKTGGGKNHRMGLYDAVFVKENHRRFGNLRKLFKLPRRYEIEVRNLRETVEAVALRPRVILFDNFSPALLKKAVKLVRAADSKIILEASGGITLQNVAAYAKTGVDQISAGALTHSVRSCDLSLLIQ